MAAAAPGTLAELAALAEMEESLFAEFTESDFEDLTKDLGLPVPARVKLRGLHNKLLANSASEAAGIAAERAEAERKQAEEEERQAAVRLQQISLSVKPFP